MKAKLENFIPQENMSNLTAKQKKDIWYAIRNKIPILFIGAAATGKSFLAKMLQEKGVIAYAPENLFVIELGRNGLKENKKAARILDLWL
ncbi:MAG: hypothetical protein FWC06_08700 [Treponema sp.]|nr:hypothetical protein [Treponema sp.]